MPRIPRQPETNIGTAGHVDHGKSTIVEAITGVWTSAHSEELRRGITIRVGYADASIYKCPNCPAPQNYSTSPKCPNCGTQGELRRVISFVDCPGHESLMANMLSGAALMDGAVLVIAANEKVPQPQTREHLLAIQMLGTKQIVIAQNKVDLVSDAEAKANYNSIKSFVAGTFAENAPIIPLSAQHKLNIDALLQAIDENIKIAQRDPNAPPMMQVLRSFDINKPGSAIDSLKGGVLGGTLLQGVFNSGDEIEIRPGLADEKSRYEPVYTKVASLVTGAGITETVKPGGLIAVGTELDPFLTKSDALVGSLIGRPDELPPVHETMSIDTQLFDLAVGAPEMIKVEKIKTGEALRLNVGTSVTLGVVSSAKDSSIQLKLRRPVCAPKGSRVAISRRIGERWRLIGSGTIS